MAVRSNPNAPASDVQCRISEAAERARSEAEARRKEASQRRPAPEIDGRKGPEPIRYGDWESKGLACDF